MKKGKIRKSILALILPLLIVLFLSGCFLGAETLSTGGGENMIGGSVMAEEDGSEAEQSATPVNQVESTNTPTIVPTQTSAPLPDNTVIPTPEPTAEPTAEPTPDPSPVPTVQHFSF